MQQLQQGATLQNGKYRIESVLGQGGFGITYVAVQTIFGNKVAIKELFVQGENDRKGNTVTISNIVYTDSFCIKKIKFLKEARRIHEIDNEHIVKVYDAFEENGTAYYVMELISGESLGARLKNSVFTETEARNALNQLLDALSVIHSRNIQHLDIKPDNILIDRFGKIKLIDFGASKHIENKGAMTTSSSLAMTPGFAAPEQMQGDMTKFGPWTDFYALGGTLYAMLTGKKTPTFDDVVSDGTSAFHFSSKISIPFQNLIIWMMNPNRNKRPKCASEIIQGEYNGDSVQVNRARNTNVVNNNKDVVTSGVSRELVDHRKNASFFAKNLTLWIMVICIAIIAVISFSLNEVRESAFDNSLNMNSSAIPSKNSSAKIITTPKKISKPMDPTNSYEWNGQAYINLGLSVAWATCNLGASSPEEYGNYYAWGETSTKYDFELLNYKWYKDPNFIKYCEEDGLRKLSRVDDAATSALGAHWKMPSKKECEELVSKCRWKWVTFKGHKGFKVTGPNGNSIFLPAAGSMVENFLLHNTSDGSYWSSSLSDEEDTACMLIFNMGGTHETYFDRRYWGGSVRPVHK